MNWDKVSAVTTFFSALVRGPTAVGTHPHPTHTLWNVTLHCIFSMLSSVSWLLRMVTFTIKNPQGICLKVPRRALNECVLLGFILFSLPLFSFKPVSDLSVGYWETNPNFCEWQVTPSQQMGCFCLWGQKVSDQKRPISSFYTCPHCFNSVRVKTSVPSLLSALFVNPVSWNKMEIIQIKHTFLYH